MLDSLGFAAATAARPPPSTAAAPPLPLPSGAALLQAVAGQALSLAALIYLDGSARTLGLLLGVCITGAPPPLLPP